MSRVPDGIPDAAVAIDLSDNHLFIIRDDDFENCSNVKILNLGNNSVHNFSNSMFQGIPNVERIDLSENYFRYDESSFLNNPFKSLAKLISVNLHRNPLSLNYFNNIEFMIKMLPLTLEELSINIPDLHGIAVLLKRFTKLKRLGLYAATPLIIRDDTFEPLYNAPIEELKIRFLQLSQVQPLAFQHFPELKTLDMSRTEGMSIANFHPAWIGLKNTKLERLNLSYFVLFESTTETVHLNGTFFQNIDLPYLVELRIDHARICSMTDEAKYFSKLVNLQILTMSHNCMDQFHVRAIAQESLQFLSNLKSIDNSYQFDIIIGQWHIDLFYDWHVFYYHLPLNLSELYLSHIRPMASMNALQGMRILLLNPSRISYFSFQHNYLTNLSEFSVLHPDPSVRFEADFSNNNMISFAGSFDVSIREHGLNVYSLILSENKLANDFADKGKDMFKEFRNLTKLELSSNGIRNLPYETFSNQHKLQYLNLSSNSLIFVSFKISHMRNIRFLDLSDNLISQFDQKLQVDIDSVRIHSPNFTINLLRNPIQCSCETHTFLWWMYRRQSMFSQFDAYTCVYGGKLIAFKNMVQSLKTMDFQCSVDLI